MSHYSSESSGPAVDVRGDPVIDPTKNVLDLVAAAIKRQDDLRDAYSSHAKEMAQLRADYEDRLRRAESARLDSIRSIDVASVQQAAAVQEARANALADQVQASAEALRTSLAAALDPLTEAVADLRRAQYEAQGQKTQVVETRSATSATTAIVAASLTAFGLIVTIAGLVVAAYLATH